MRNYRSALLGVTARLRDVTHMDDPYEMQKQIQALSNEYATLASEIQEQFEKLGLKLVCEYCGLPITKPGALLFSPPNNRGICKKVHICVKCFNKPENDK